jgi:hypothetical protein
MIVGAVENLPILVFINAERRGERVNGQVPSGVNE